MIKYFLISLIKNLGMIAAVTAGVCLVVLLCYIISPWIMAIVIGAVGLIVLSWTEASTRKVLAEAEIIFAKQEELRQEKCVLQVKLNNCDPNSKQHLEISTRILKINEELDDLDLMLTNLCK
jgi:hypothetical protein